MFSKTKTTANKYKWIKTKDCCAQVRPKTQKFIFKMHILWIRRKNRNLVLLNLCEKPINTLNLQII